MNWYLKALKQYANFNGRARRKEYWTFTLINALIAITIVFIESKFLNAFDEDGFGFIYIAYALVMFLPTIAVSVRRLHDIGRSGYVLLVTLIPGIGGILMLIYTLQQGEPGSNRYGPDPKQTEEESH